MTEHLINSPLSRRRFVTSVSAFALAQSALGTRGIAETVEHNGRYFAYAGTYTTARDGSANGEGIYLFEVNVHTGELGEPRLAAKTPNPTWLAIHPTKKYLYTVNEMTGHDGASQSAVTAYALNSQNGSLTHLNSVSSEGAGPAHMSIDAQGRFAFVANYAGGTIAVLPIHEDGTLGSAVDVHRDADHIGSLHATNAPRGSFAISGHESPHAHMIMSDPGNKFVLHTDLAQDRLYVYKFDAATGKLTPAAVPYFSLPTGDGPRHFVFHPNGRWLYLIEEEASVVVFFHYNPETGALSSQQTISALPLGFAGSNMASEIAISSNGKHLYSANRLHDSIAVFSVGPSGRLTYVGEASTMGDYPRHFCLDPSGKFAYACDQRSDCIVSYTVDRQSGMLAFTGKYTALGSPANLVFLT